MKRIVLFAVLFGFMSSGTFAQDDMYFTPKKDDVEAERQYVDMGDVGDEPYGYAYRDVDEYNRRGRFADNYWGDDLDSLYSDVILLDSVPVDTAAVEDDFDNAYNPEDDYTYSRQMSRYDDYYWCDPWLYGWYWPYWWYGSPYWWYAGWWYDPWYDPWFYGWYRPWGWYYPIYSYYRPHRGVTGTANHGRPYRHYGAAGNFRGYRGNGNTSRGNSSFTGNRYSTGSYNSNYNNRFRGNWQDSYNSQSYYPSRSTYNSSSFGGSRSGGFRGGGSFGGSRGGGFGGRR